MPESAAALSPVTPAGLPRRVCLAVALATAVIVIGPEWLEPYVPGCDEAHMLQAATRLARGDGLTTTWHDDLADISRPTYHHSHAWPPLFSWFFAALLKLGIGHAAGGEVLKLLKFVAAAAGTYGWLRLGGRILPSPGAWLFAAAVPGLFFPMNFIYGPSHLYYWAVMPFCISRLLTGLQTRRLRDFALSGLLAALAISVRYNLYIVPAGAAAAFLLTTGGFFARTLAAAAFAIPPAAVMGGYMLYNVLCSGAATWVNELGTTITFSNVLFRQPLTVWFAFGFGLEESIFKLRPSWRVDLPFLVFAPWYFLLGLVGLIGAWLGRRLFSTEQRRFLAVTVLITGALVCMLAAISLRMNPDDGWVVINHDRYYSEALPAVGIAWLLLLCSCVPGMVVPTALRSLIESGAGEGTSADAAAEPPTARAEMPRLNARIVLGLLVACVVIVMEVRGLYLTTRRCWRKIRDIAEIGIRQEAPLPALVARLLAGSPVPRHRFFDTWWSRAQTLIRDDSVKYRKIDGSNYLSAAKCSDPVYVVVVVRWRWNDGPGMAEEYEGNTEGASIFARFLGLRRTAVVWDEGNLCEVFTGVVQPFAAHQRGEPTPGVAPPPERPTPEMVGRDNP